MTDVYRLTFFDVFTFVACIFLVYMILRKIWQRTIGDSLQPSTGKVVIITGCDTGFGLEAALKLVGDGYVVFCGCLNAKTAISTSYAGLLSDKLHVVQMNVKSDEEVAGAVDIVSQWLDANPTHRLTAVVANAGVAPNNYLELLSMTTFQNAIDINLLGAVRVYKAFLPVMRRNSCKIDGRLIGMASMSARLPALSMTCYGASKAGLLAFSNCLRLEVARFGVSVSVILPDFYPTPMVMDFDRQMRFADELFDQTDSTILEDYGGREALRAKLVKSLKSMPTLAHKDNSPVINAICHAVGSRRPKREYYPIGVAARLLLFVNAISPSLADRLLTMFE